VAYTEGVTNATVFVLEGSSKATALTKISKSGLDMIHALSVSTLVKNSEEKWPE